MMKDNGKMNNAEQNIKSLVKNIETSLKGFSSIQLHELLADSHMSRFDNKYVFSSVLLPDLLNRVKEHYDVLELDGYRLLNYQSCYYDTSLFEMYLAHHNGKRNRFKIRFREYMESGDKYLEIKNKNNKGITTKQRIQVNTLDPDIPESKEFIEQNSLYKLNTLNPTLQTNYKRLTLINKNVEKRITIDCSLEFLLGDNKLSLPGIAIAEIKNLDRNPTSRFNRILDSYGIKKSSFSKYAIGVALLNEQIKKNNFKRKLNKIDVLQDEFNKYFNAEYAQ